MSRFSETATRLFSLALPLAAGMLFQVAFNLVDAYFIGKLGTDAFAAVNLASFSVWLLSAIVGVVGTGANAKVAQAMGAGKAEVVVGIRSQALRAAVLIGFLTTLGGLWGVKNLTFFLSSGEEETRMAALLSTQYLSTIFLAAPLLCFNDTMAALFRGTGDTRTPTKILSCGFLVNACLDPILIFGYGPFPRLGVIGAALATILSFLFSTLAFVAIRREWFRKTATSPPVDLLEIFKIGLPPSITNIVFCVVYMLVTPYIASQGAEALAALGLGHKVISLSYFTCLAFSLAAITLTGESTGAEDPAEAHYRSWVIVSVAALTNFGVGAFLMLNATNICSLFSADPEVLKMSSNYLYIVVPSQILLGIGMAIEGSFAGFGRTEIPMVISVLSSTLRWPAVAWVLTATEAGVTGVWWVFALSTHLRGLALLALLLFRPKSHFR